MGDGDHLLEAGDCGGEQEVIITVPIDAGVGVLNTYAGIGVGVLNTLLIDKVCTLHNILYSLSGDDSIGGLARYCVHTTATWDQFRNIIKKVRNHSDGVSLVSP